METSSSPQKRFDTNATIFIPNILSRIRWPWPREVNPNYAVVKKETDAWISSFRVFSPKAQDAFDRCDFDLLACLAYPKASKEHARAGCDLMHMLFLYDEYADWATPAEARQEKDAVMDALRNPYLPRPKGEWIGGEMFRQFWVRIMQDATAGSQTRFLQVMDECLEYCIQECVDKRDRRIPNIKGYIDARRDLSAVKAAFIMCELGLDIPEEVMMHPAIQEMNVAAIDIIALSNDIYSYNLEQMRSIELYNIITSVMHEHHTDVNGAILWVEDFLWKTAERFHGALAALPKWEEPLNSQVKQYCHRLGQWVRGNNEWSFESVRYFGKKGLEIKEKNWMTLLPKTKTTEIGPIIPADPTPMHIQLRDTKLSLFSKGSFWRSFWELFWTHPKNIFERLSALS